MSAVAVGPFKEPRESEQVGIRAERVFERERTTRAHTHTPLEMVGWASGKKYLLFSPLLRPLMAADSTKTRSQRITMSFIGHRGGLLPACHSPLLSSYKPLP